VRQRRDAQQCTSLSLPVADDGDEALMCGGAAPTRRTATSLHVSRRRRVVQLVHAAPARQTDYTYSRVQPVIASARRQLLAFKSLKLTDILKHDTPFAARLFAVANCSLFRFRVRFTVGFRVLVSSTIVLKKSLVISCIPMF